MAELTLLDERTVLIEKGHPEEQKLRRWFSQTREMDHHREYRLRPWLVWQTVYHLGAGGAGWERLFSGFERGEGCLKQLAFLEKQGMDLIGERTERHPNRTRPEREWDGDLRPEQRKAAESYFTRPASPSLVVLPPGKGKTRIALEVAKMLGGARVWASNATLVRQWKAEGLKWWPGPFSKQPKGSPPSPVDLRFGGPEKPEDLVGAPLLILDEVHRLDAITLDLLAEAKVPVLGLTATPMWSPELDLAFFAAFGPTLLPLQDEETTSTAVQVRAVEIQFDLPHELRHEYLLAPNGLSRHRLAGNNRLKVAWVLDRLKETPGARVLVMGQYLEPLKEIAASLGVSVLSGTASAAARFKAYQKFNAESKETGAVLVTSGISDEGVDLPEADLIFQLSGSPNDPVQEVQRLGRLLRPKNRTVTFYTLVTSRTVEEESSRQRRGAVEALGILYALESPSPETIRL